MQFSMRIREQVVQAVTVPAGNFASAYRTVAEGTVSGLLGNVAIKSGSITQTSWFVVGVGLVREDRVLDLIFAVPNGTEATAFEESTKVLEQYRIP